MDTDKNQLVEQIRTGGNSAALEAVKTLRERGWLMDGSLKGMNFSGADLSTADLNHARLENVDFSGASLFSADLSFANLRGESNFHQVDLRSASLEDTLMDGALLTEAKLSSAQMIGTRLQAAVLSDADFSGALMIGADLRGAFLNRTTFGGTLLRSVDFREARLSGTVFMQSEFESVFMSRAEFANVIFARVNLSNCVGLNEVVHVRGSHIDLPTLYLSRKRLSLEFLKDATMGNVDEAMLEAIFEIFQREV